MDPAETCCKPRDASWPQRAPMDWMHPNTKESIEFVFVCAIDVCSRFGVAKFMNNGRKQTMSASDFLQFMESVGFRISDCRTACVWIYVELFGVGKRNSCAVIGAGGHWQLRLVSKL